MGKWLRSPKTVNERRKWSDTLDWIKEGFSIKLRSKRSPAALPDNYDDIQRMDLHHRNWKRQRKTEYKPDAG